MLLNNTTTPHSITVQKRSELIQRLGQLTAQEFLMIEELKQIQDEANKIYRQLTDRGTPNL